MAHHTKRRRVGQCARTEDGRLQGDFEGSRGQRDLTVIVFTLKRIAGKEPSPATTPRSRSSDVCRARLDGYLTSYRFKRCEEDEHERNPPPSHGVDNAAINLAYASRHGPHGTNESGTAWVFDLKS